MLSGLAKFLLQGFPERCGRRAVIVNHWEGAVSATEENANQGSSEATNV